MASDKANALIEELKRDAQKGELLLWASARGLTADVVELVQTGADLSAKDKNARQALHFAASNGHLDILEYLFTKGVLLDAEDDVGRGALHYAAAGGHAACVSFLLSKQCWRDAPDAVDDTPLHLAARAGGVAAVRALLEAGAKPAVRNKRSLTPFAEAVLAGRIEAAELLGAAMEGGLAGALAITYRDAPLLHLAAGLGQVAAVEWLVRRQQVDVSTATTQRRYTPLHAAALSGDPDTVAALLKLGADPLSQTLDGKLPLELVPRAAPPKAPLPQSPQGGAAAAPPRPPPSDDPDAAAAEAADDPALVRSARRAFRVLARAAAAQGGVELGGGKSGAQTAVDKRKRSAKAVAAAPAPAPAPAEAEAEAEAEVFGEMEDAGPEFDTPAAICLRQLLSMNLEQQIAKVETYARMDERQVQELSYLDLSAQAAVTALRQAMAMVELFGAVAALRTDEDFQSDIRDPRVRDALTEVKRTNDLSRYEDQPGVMSVAAKFKRLHAVTRKAGGLQVVIDDLRAELPGNDPTSTAAKMAELRAVQRESGEAAVQAVLSSVSAAVPEHVRERIARSTVAADTAGAAAVAESTGAAAGGGGGGGKAVKGPAATDCSPEAGDGFKGEDDAAFRARMTAQKERMDKLRAAATSAWSSNKAHDEAVGYVDRVEREFEKSAARAEGKYRWRLADYVGEELALSLEHTLRALLLTAAAFLLMWLFGLMPQQQTAALMAKEEQLQAAARTSARLSQLEGLGEGDGEGGAAAAGAAGLEAQVAGRQ